MRYTLKTLHLLRAVTPVLFPAGRNYNLRVLKLFTGNILAYWPLWEASGSVIADISGNGHNGTYADVTLGQPGIGDGHTSPLFDGAASYGDVTSAGLSTLFNGAEGTLAIWAKVSAAPVWGDGALRRAIHHIVDASNLASIWKAAAANSLTLSYIAGGTTKEITITTTSTAWNHYALTWSASGDQVKAYLNGAQTGSMLTGLGAWTRADVVSLIGANSVVPANVWSGWLAHALLLDRPATPAEIANLAVV